MRDIASCVRRMKPSAPACGGHRGLHAVAWLLGLIVLAEDAVSFLMMDLPLVNLLDYLQRRAQLC